MTDESKARVSFRLEQDEDGYPPVALERLWADRVQEGLYRLDNVPFYVKNVSSGDVVAVEALNDELSFLKVVRASGNSVVRIYVLDIEDVQASRDEFRGLGCESELSDVPKLFALEVPASSEFAPVAQLIDAGVNQRRWEYEVGVMRHRFPQSHV